MFVTPLTTCAGSNPPAMMRSVDKHIAVLDPSKGELAASAIDTGQGGEHHQEAATNEASYRAGEVQVSTIDAKGTIVMHGSRGNAKHRQPPNNAKKGEWSEMDGGLNKACRGKDSEDNEKRHKVVISGEAVAKIEACKDYCVQTPGCQGISHNQNEKRCEAWIRPRGIQATKDEEYTTCLTYVPGTWGAADGGVNRACRGANKEDDKDEYFALVDGAGMKTLADCKRRCINTFGCKGIEHHPTADEGHCEIWTRSEGIEATEAADGYTCLSFESDEEAIQWPGVWTPVDGGVNRACRGENPNDDDNSYYTKHEGMEVLSLDACRRLCVNTLGCRGIEHNPRGQCEIWTRSAGIGASKVVDGYSCLSWVPGKWMQVDGGANRACRGKDESDDRMDYFLEKHGASMMSIDACKRLCMEVSGCLGIEHHPSGHCEVWTTKISASHLAPGFTCLKYVAEDKKSVPLIVGPAPPAPGPPGRSPYSAENPNAPAAGTPGQTTQAPHPNATHHVVKPHHSTTQAPTNNTTTTEEEESFARRDAALPSGAILCLYLGFMFFWQ